MYFGGWTCDGVIVVRGCVIELDAVGMGFIYAPEWAAGQPRQATSDDGRTSQLRHTKGQTVLVYWPFIDE